MAGLKVSAILIVFMIVYSIIKDSTGRDRLKFPLFTNCTPIKREFNYKEA